MHRRDVHDRATARGELRAYRLRRDEGAAQVPGLEGVPFLDRRLGQGLEQLYRGVVDECVDLLEPGEGSSQGGGVADIDRDRGPARLADVEADDVPAGRRESLARRSADPARGPGDDCDPAHPASRPSRRLSIASSLVRSTPSRVLEALCDPSTHCGSGGADARPARAPPSRHREPRRQMPGLEGLDQRLLVHETASSDVDEDASARHERERTAVDDSLRLARQRETEHEEVAAAEQLLEGHRLDPVAHGPLSRGLGDVVRPDIQAEPLAATRQGRADAAVAENPQCLAGQADSLELEPTTGGNRGVNAVELPGRDHEVAGGHVGHVLSEHSRSVHDLNPERARGSEVDAVGSTPHLEMIRIRCACDSTRSLSGSSPRSSRRSPR